MQPSTAPFWWPPRTVKHTLLLLKTSDALEGPTVLESGVAGLHSAVHVPAQAAGGRCQGWQMQRGGALMHSQDSSLPLGRRALLRKPAQLSSSAPQQLGGDGALPQHTNARAAGQGRRGYVTSWPPAMALEALGKT